MKFNKIIYISFIIITFFFITSCKKEEVKLTFYANDGTFSNGDYTIEEKYFVGEKIKINIETPIRDGYIFNGWCLEDGTKVKSFVIEKETILYATWKEKTYTVTYMSNEGYFKNNITKKEVQYKSKEYVDLDIEIPTKEHYNFVGWYYQDDTLATPFNIDKDVVLYAKWEEKTYTVTYILNEGYFGDNTKQKEITYTYNELVNFDIETPVKENYNFVGWYYQDNTLATIFNIENDVVLYAKWEEKTYTVTYILNEGTFNDGTNQKTIKCKINSLFVYGEIPFCEGLMFNGWYDVSTNEYIYEGTIINKDIIAVALFKEPGNLEQITYVLNGGTMDHSTEDVYHENLFYYLPTPTKEGFIFRGWYDNSDYIGNAISIQDDTVRGSITYYALWEVYEIDALNIIVNELIPSKAYENLYFPLEYQGVYIKYTSDNPETISKSGIVSLSHKQENVTITLEINFREQTYLFERMITVDAIKFEKETSPIAGYFFRKNIATKTELLLNNLNIAYYAFANISETGMLHIEGMASFEKFVKDSVELRKNGLQIVLSIAGGAANFSNACYNGGYVNVGDQIIELIKTYHFDGVDIDWEFPSGSTDKQNMVELVKYLREELTKLEDGTGSSYILTAAIPSHTAYSRFNLKELNKYLDYVNMMSYDMHSAYKTTHNCPLYSAYNDRNSGNGIDRGIKYFTEAGLDKDKIIIGGAYYGKAYKVTGTAYNPSLYPGLGASAEPLYLQLGTSYTVFYSYILDNILTNPKYVRYWDKDACLPYLYNEEEQIFITYEDEESLQAKTEYAFNEGVGMMFWEYSYDYNNILTHAICKKMESLKARK